MDRSKAGGSGGKNGGGGGDDGITNDVTDGPVSATFPFM